MGSRERSGKGRDVSTGNLLRRAVGLPGATGGARALTQARAESGVGLFRSMVAGLRTAILEEALPGGLRLPASRVAAELLGVSRSTAVSVYEQLAAEGYVIARAGAGTFVADLKPDPSVRATAATGRPPITRHRRPVRISKRARDLERIVLGRRRIMEPVPFRPGLPALDRLPVTEWSRLYARAVRALRRADFTYGDPCGLSALREALSSYLRLSRGVHCTPGEIIIVNGSQEALHLAALVLGDAGTPAYVEDPGYSGARAAFASAGLVLSPVPLDDEGMDVDRARSIVKRAGIIYTTPSHQFPMGTSMPTQRRLGLLALAERARSFVIEDDYDSEYRYAGVPLPALQGLAARHGTAEGRVIYVGTFSKVLFPAMRIGYIVVPPRLVGAFARVRALLSRHSPALPQAALAAFFESGGFFRHVKRMRRLYAERRSALVAAVTDQIGPHARIVSGPGGMHLAATLSEHKDSLVAEAAQQLGIEVSPISELSMRYTVNGIALGFAGFSERALTLAAGKLGQAFGAVHGKRRRR